jgi:hypothetical protein
MHMHQWLQQYGCDLEDVFSKMYTVVGIVSNIVEAEYVFKMKSYASFKANHFKNSELIWHSD